MGTAILLNLGLMFRVMGIVLFVQLALGGLVTFGYLDWTVHVFWGVILGILAIVTLVYVLRMPSRPKQLVGLTVGIGVDILVQAMLGFAAQDMGNEMVSWVHFLNALAIYGMTLFGTFMATAAARMSEAHPTSTPGP